MFKMIPSYCKYVREYGVLMTDNIKNPTIVRKGDVVAFNERGNMIESTLAYGAVFHFEKSIKDYEEDDLYNDDNYNITKDLLFANYNNFNTLAAYNGKLLPGYTKVSNSD